MEAAESRGRNILLLFTSQEEMREKKRMLGNGVGLSFMLFTSPGGGVEAELYHQYGAMEVPGNSLLTILELGGPKLNYLNL